MKQFGIIMSALIINSVLISYGNAGDKALNGMVIGAGSGAIIGQIAGRDTEATLAGTAIGGAVGYVIGHRMDADQGQKIIIHKKQHQPKAVQPKRYISHYRNKPYHSPKQYRARKQVCYETVKRKKHHGKSTRIVTTTCKNEKFNSSKKRFRTWKYNRKNNPIEKYAWYR